MTKHKLFTLRFKNTLTTIGLFLAMFTLTTSLGYIFFDVAGLVWMGILAFLALAFAPSIPSKYIIMSHPEF